MNWIVNLILQVGFALIIAPLTFGIISKIKAWSQHRIGAPFLQPYYNIAKLMKKDVLVSDTTSWIFRVAPYIYFISTLVAVAIIPIVPGLAINGFAGDAIFVVYLLAMGRFFLVMAGLDAGSTFGGMGSSREMMISSLIEPSIMAGLFTIGLTPAVQSLNITEMFQNYNLFGASGFLLLGSFMIAVIVETARIPVDDPSTHLELTMVHEAMVLEYSGRNLALIELASAVKQIVFSTLIVNIFLPFGCSVGGSLGFCIDLGFYFLKILGITIFIGIIEINAVKFRLFSVTNLAAISFILAFMGFVAAFVLEGV
ncbi:MAG: NADH-quinone oxidoreductase subunit H [Eubacteriales bacterium]